MKTKYEISEFKKKLVSSVDFIEENLQTNVTLSDIADASNLSPYYFLNLFRTLNGYTPFVYLQCRRLSQAAIELITTDKPIIEITFDYQFNSQEAFSRAFKNRFHISPLKYRNYGIRHSILERPSDPIMALSGNRFILNPEIICKPRKYYVGLRRVGDNSHPENMRLTFELLSRAAEIKNCISAPLEVYYISRYFFDSNGKELYDIYIAVEVTEIKDLPKGLVGLELSEQWYATFRFCGTLQSIVGQYYRYIFDKWLPSSGLNFTSKYQYEHIRGNFRCLEQDYVEIGIPVD